VAPNLALGTALAGQGVVQLVVGVSVGTGEVVGPIASFALRTVGAVALLMP